MAWIYLLLAGIMEWGWPIGLKLAWRNGQLYFWPAAGGVVSMAASGFLLFLAQRHLPVGTAYAIWTGIGAVGTFILGIFILGESAGTARVFSVSLIVAGIVGLKLSAGE